jgi:hypothetical protein
MRWCVGVFSVRSKSLPIAAAGVGGAITDGLSQIA